MGSLAHANLRGEGDRTPLQQQECKHVGKLEVVKVSLASISPHPSSHPAQSSLHLVVSLGHPAAAQEIIGVSSGIVWNLDHQGPMPQHLHGHHMEEEEEDDDDKEVGEEELSEVGVPLSLEELNNSIRDSTGEACRHLAAERRQITIIDDIWSTHIDLANLQTERRETIIHLCVKNKRYEALKYFVKNLKIEELEKLGDHNGNAIYHIASLKMLRKMVKLVSQKNKVDASERCESSKNKSPKKQHSKSAGLTEPIGLHGQASYFDNLREEVDTDEQLNLNQLQMLVRHLLSESGRNLKDHSCCHCQSPPLQERNVGHATAGIQHNQGRQSRRKVRGMYSNDELRKAFSTLTMIALLLAGVTMISVLRPPRVLSIPSESSSALSKAFKTSSIVTLFLSLCSLTQSTTVLLSKQRPSNRQLVVNQAFILLTSTSMAVGFACGTWMGLPPAGRKRLLRMAMLCIQVGSVGLLTIGSIAMATKRGLQL